MCYQHIIIKQRTESIELCYWLYMKILKKVSQPQGNLTWSYVSLPSRTLCIVYSILYSYNFNKSVKVI